MIIRINSRKHAALGHAEVAILMALARFHYATASQICRLLFSPGSLRYAQSKLKRLADQGYALRIFLPRNSQRGSAPMVYTLTRRGRNQLEAHGHEVYKRFHPSEEHTHSYLFLAHTLQVNDFLIAAELLARQQSGVIIDQVLHERELKHRPVYIPGQGTGERVAVIPDAWLDIALPARNERRCIAVEVDRSTMSQARWKQKVTALIAFCQGPYQEAFGREAITIIVVTPTEKRRDDLLIWTQQTLSSLQQAEEADLFRFASVDAAVVRPGDVFLSPIWYVPFAADPVPLLEVGRGEGV
jgi:DNA-binding MarR family transcriptional regulator